MSSSNDPTYETTGTTGRRDGVSNGEREGRGSINPIRNTGEPIGIRIGPLVCLYNVWCTIYSASTPLLIHTHGTIEFH